MRVLAATTNEGKLKEIKRIMEPLGFEVVEPKRKLKVEESGTSFLENAYLKACAYYKEFGLTTIADDSGLVVNSLQGYPGIFSSRFYSLDFGGKELPEPSATEANIRKLLRLLKGIEDRGAKFVACVVLYTGDKGLFAEGECKGEILEEKRGEGGFGYDPIFKPEGFEGSMAQLSPEEKDRISHRGKALRKLSELLGGLGYTPQICP